MGFFPQLYLTDLIEERNPRNKSVEERINPAQLQNDATARCLRVWKNASWRFLESDLLVESKKGRMWFHQA